MTGDFKEMVLTHQEYPFDINPRNLLTQYELAKRHLREKFGNKLRIRSKEPIYLQATTDNSVKAACDYINRLTREGLATDDLVDFIYANDLTFMQNLVSQENKYYDIKRGSKISKSLKKFFTNHEDLRRAQDIASTFMQFKGEELGYLWLSIDPRDFLTMSENNNGWRSCMALDGGCRASVLSYMVDEVTAVAYIADEEEQPLRAFDRKIDWNNKRYRFLVHINDDVVYYNKIYPSASADDQARFYNSIWVPLLEMIGADTLLVPSEINYSFPQTEYRQMVMEGRIFDSRDVFDTSDLVGFSDLIEGINYTGRVSILNKDKGKKYLRIAYQERSNKQEEEEAFMDLFAMKIGNRPLCVKCGRQVLTPDRHDTFLCESCEANYNAEEDFFAKCDFCYQKIHSDQERYPDKETGRVYCLRCFRSSKKKGGNK